MRNLVNFTDDLHRGVWLDEETDDLDNLTDLCYDKHKPLDLKCGFVCFECNQNVLAYSQPFGCGEHE